MDKLKNIFATKGAAQKAEVKEFLKTYSDKVIDDVTISQTAGGMRDIISMLYETSLLDAHEGIRFRGYSIPELIEKLPKAQGGTQPLAEGIFWLMLTGDIPTQEDVNEFSKDLARRSNVPQHVFETIESLPKDMQMAYLRTFTGIQCMRMRSIWLPESQKLLLIFIEEPIRMASICLAIQAWIGVRILPKCLAMKAIFSTR